MVEIGDKIFINKTKSGRYVGIKSGETEPGDIIGNNIHSWKSGNPSVGEILVNNGNIAFKSGERTILVPNCPYAPTIINTYKVHDGTRYNAGPYNASNIYASNGWDRDTDHEIRISYYTISAFSPEISFIADTEKYTYWLSGNYQYLDIAYGDDMSIYINGSRTSLQGSGFGPNITSLLVNGTNTIKSFYKMWWYSGFWDVSVLYVYEIDSSNDNYIRGCPEKSKCYYKINDLQFDTGYTSYQTPVITINKGENDDIILSGTPYLCASYGSDYLMRIKIQSYNYDHYNTKAEVYKEDGTLLQTITALELETYNVINGLETGENKIYFIYYIPSGEKIRYVGQSYLVRRCNT